MQKQEMILLQDDGWLNIVLDIPKESKGWIVLSHGLTGDRSGPQRILTNWAQSLCHNGYTVVRFDFRGSGDSSFFFERTTLSQMQRDLEAVIDWCASYLRSSQESSLSNLVLAGLSLGGVVSLMAMSKYKQCKALFLFSSDVNDTPSFDLKEDPLSIRDGQFFLHKKFFEERLNLFPEQLLASAFSPCFLVYGQNDKKICSMAKNLRKSSDKLITIEIEKTGHLFESVSARSAAINKMIFELEKLIPR